MEKVPAVNNIDKILFLDIDGVLNNTDTIVKHSGGGVCKVFDPACVRQLWRIIDRTKCKIVLSSTWRLGGVESVFDPIKLACLGRPKSESELIIEAFIGRTPSHVPGKRERGYEIGGWIKENNFSGKFAILDDDSDMVHLSDHLVQTKFQTGLTKKDADKVITLLMS